MQSVKKTYLEAFLSTPVPEYGFKSMPKPVMSTMTEQSTEQSTEQTTEQTTKQTTKQVSEQTSD